MIQNLPVNIQHFFNTINLCCDDLVKAVSQCKKQENMIFNLFKLLPGRELTPFQVQTILIHSGFLHPKTPITSIRRAMTNLTEAGLLVKTDKTVKEEFGKLNHLWKLYIPQLKQIQGKLEF